MWTRFKRGITPLAAMIVLCGLCSACFQSPTRCEGECPAPEPGVVTDRGVVHKRVWLDSPSVGESDNAELFCWLDNNASSGRSLVFRSSQGTQVIRVAGAEAEEVLTFPHGTDDSMSISDVDADGFQEFVFWDAQRETVRFYDETGRHRFTVSEVREWDFVDVDSDGVKEFISKTRRGIELRNIDGAVRAQFGDGQQGVWVGVATDGTVYFLTAADYYDWDDGNFQTWSADGDPLPAVDRSQLDMWNLLGDGNHSGADWSPLGCGQDLGLDVEKLSGISSPYTVRIDGTRLVRDVPNVFFEISTLSQTIRTILRVYGADGSIVYEEVLESGSGAGFWNRVILPSGQSGSDTLLLVDDHHRILAYTFD